MAFKLTAIFTAYLLDLIIGDPNFAWHPVRIIGKLIVRLEKILNNGRSNSKSSGLLLVILVVSLSVTSVLGLLRLSALIHPAFHFIIYTLLIYFSICVKCLAKEAGSVYNALNKNDLPLARKKLSMIVARDSGNLDEPQIIRATVETVAESTMDGIISPLFYAFLGGPVLAWVYKAVNTLDSMVGYKNDRFLKFGAPSAILDGIFNYIPSKITCFAILAASYCCAKFHKGSWQIIFKYLFKGKDYNSEATEAVMASALGVQLGGLNFYDSVVVEKNLIGKNIYPLKKEHIRESITIAYASSALFMAFGILFINLIPRLVIPKISSIFLG